MFPSHWQTVLLRATGEVKRCVQVEEECGKKLETAIVV